MAVCEVAPAAATIVSISPAGTPRLYEGVTLVLAVAINFMG